MSPKTGTSESHYQAYLIMLSFQKFDKRHLMQNNTSDLRAYPMWWINEDWWLPTELLCWKMQSQPQGLWIPEQFDQYVISPRGWHRCQNTDSTGCPKRHGSLLILLASVATLPSYIGSIAASWLLTELKILPQIFQGLSRYESSRQHKLQHKVCPAMCHQWLDQVQFSL